MAIQITARQQSWQDGLLAVEVQRHLCCICRITNWDQKAPGKRGTQVHLGLMLGPLGGHSSAKIKDQGLSETSECRQETCCWVNYLRGTWKGRREGSYRKEAEWCSKVIYFRMRRGGIFVEFVVSGTSNTAISSWTCHTVSMLGFVSGWDILPLHINREGFPFSCLSFCKELEAQLILVTLPRRHKGMCATKASFLPAHLPLLSENWDLVMVIRQFICRN